MSNPTILGTNILNDYNATYNVFLPSTMLYYILSAAAVYGNKLYWYVLYSKIGPIMLGSAESAMPLVYSCSPMTSN